MSGSPGDRDAARLSTCLDALAAGDAVEAVATVASTVAITNKPQSAVFAIHPTSCKLCA